MEGKQFITEIPPIKKKQELKKRKKKKHYEVKETGASTNFNDVETRSFANKSFQNNDELHLEDECGILIHFLGEFYTFTEAGFFAAMLLLFFYFFPPYALEHNLFFEAFYNSYRWDARFFSFIIIILHVLKIFSNGSVKTLFSIYTTWFYLIR